MSDRRRHGFVLLLVVGLIAASAVVIASKATRLGLDLKGGVELVYEAQPTKQTPVVTAAALQRVVQVMNNRVNQLGVTQPQIQTTGSNLIDVQLPDVTNIDQAEQAVGSTARLEFYDWEDNVLTPSGQTVRSLLPVKDTTALDISQGTTSAGPGTSSSASGAMAFYPAVELAAKQPAHAHYNSAFGTEYYLFGAPGSSTCAAYYKAQQTKSVKGLHCFIAGPVRQSGTMTRTAALQELKQGLTKGELHGSQLLVVKEGNAVLQASPASFAVGKWPKYGSPNAGYYVVHDNVALFGNDITNPQASSDSTTGTPDVSFGFTSKGATEFSKVTQNLAVRGKEMSVGSSTSLYQHFAVALDDQLLTVPQIDFNEYPDGLGGSGGASISGGFTASTAGSLATQLRLGALPVTLRQISVSETSATLGSQALHQGLIAGLAGLAIVVIFLLAYYRLLGLIAVGGLLVYGVYFYALIKLIPITMSLAGIAGLILTIGVAADANIVIFERVKEEIRAGRSVRQGIAIGYRKGLSAIIDANVVTIMTAFILFVLATSDVKGFAFTLGIGTFVSLFTAVLATQAILMTVGDSRAIQSPSVLGAGAKHRRWRFDFMGASRYFFSMSGVILLVGALAIGGRGLNLGIDFTGGTQVTVGFTHYVSIDKVKAIIASEGGGDATVQAVRGKTTGKYGFQIQSKYLGTKEYSALRNDFQNIGIQQTSTGKQDFSSQSVGPTFGSSVTHSALVAIIISLLLISLYVTLRFDWKFAIPVLIALMHDLLITAGVYALTGRVVTADTVAALLTILGYSMYDTIIVFDRVRENIPRMPRASFSQIVNRSMSEVLTRSLATTSCTLLPIIALLLFGGSTLKDFAFAMLIGVASGAYSSIFIASPVLTHWKEREHGFSTRRARIVAEYGVVPAYADGGDVEPVETKVRPTGRLTQPMPETVSAAEFEQMKSELGLPQSEQPRPKRAGKRQAPVRPAANPAAVVEPEPTVTGEADKPVTPAPDIPENEGVAPVQNTPKRPRNRKHGRRR